MRPFTTLSSTPATRLSSSANEKNWRWAQGCQQPPANGRQQAIAQLLSELNDKPLTAPREGSRRSSFEAVQRAALKLFAARIFET